MMTEDKKTSWRNKKSDLRRLVLLMNRQNNRFWPPLDPILKTVDLVIEPEELNLLLKMGTDLYTYDQVALLSGMNSEKFDAVFDSLKKKAFIGIKNPETSGERYTLHPFVVGWFEARCLTDRQTRRKRICQRYMGFLGFFCANQYFSPPEYHECHRQTRDRIQSSVGTVR
jgi:hypothetical protein